ncbi:MAG: hypothetical protein KKC51_13070 [Verrucomicrobia bacterium]|nr:hypothetical protein [Verrucomicrobiota bacterium]
MSAQVKERGRIGVLGWTLLFLLAGLMPGWAVSVEYVVKQIGDENYFNRDPVISETGFAAWTAYVSAEGEESASEIHLYENGQSRPLTRGNVPGGTTHYRPCVYSNFVAWIGSFPSPKIGEDNWTLREVPDAERDTPYEELAAFPVSIPEEQKPEEGATNGTPEEAAAGPQAKGAPGPTGSGDLGTAAARRGPSGVMEACVWFGDEIKRLSWDWRNDFGISLWGRTAAWQKSKGWPFGWEIMVWNDGEMYQLTTNFYYDMAPQVQGNQVVWYGWDGNDYEIFLHDRVAGITLQVTSNRYDDVAPVVWDGVVAWEAYPGADAEIFLWQDGRFQRLSDNPWDDTNPRIWNGKVVWQGFDGDDFEIYYFNGEKTVKLTSNRHDDVNPDIRDGFICWMAYYDNWDSEIFAWDIDAGDYVTLIDEQGRAGSTPGRLSYNEVEDREPRTAGRRVIWQVQQEGKSLIQLAEPRQK